MSILVWLYLWIPLSQVVFLAAFALASKPERREDGWGEAYGGAHIASGLFCVCATSVHMLVRELS
jgi:hypothetical protein